MSFRVKEDLKFNCHCASNQLELLTIECDDSAYYIHPMLHFDVACNTLWQADLLTKTKGEQWSFFGSDGMVIFFWVTQPSPLTDFQPPDHCFQWFFDGFGVIQPLVSMVFNCYGPLVPQCDGFNGSFTSKLSQNWKFKLADPAVEGDPGIWHRSFWLETNPEMRKI